MRKQTTVKTKFMHRVYFPGHVPPLNYEDFEGICRPIAEWYQQWMSEDYKRTLPVRVANALDSLTIMVRKKS